MLTYFMCDSKAHDDQQCSPVVCLCDCADVSAVSTNMYGWDGPTSL